MSEDLSDMEITPQLTSDLEQDLLEAANRDRVTEPIMTWPQAVLDYVSEPDFPAFEADRGTLLPPSSCPYV